MGTHAFLTLGNLLGVHWKVGVRTQDLDFAHAGKSISIALPASIQVDVPKTLESLQMGFLPMSALRSDQEATYFRPRDPELRIDFLTPRHRGADALLKVANLNVKLQPLKFMEYLLEHSTQAVLFCEEGAVVGNVPAPLHYGLGGRKRSRESNRYGSSAVGVGFAAPPGWRQPGHWRRSRPVHP